MSTSWVFALSALSALTVTAAVRRRLRQIEADADEAFARLTAEWVKR